MGLAIALRGGFDGPGLRRLVKASKDAGQSRRPDRVLRFNADGPGALIDRKAPGNSPKPNDRLRRSLDQVQLPPINEKAMAPACFVFRGALFKYDR